MQPRVQIIEDDLTIQDQLRELLEGEGYRVLVANATLDPVDASRLHPNLIVLDLWLGGSAWGWDWLHDLRVTSDARGIPVIVCTADTGLAQREAEQLQTLATDLILKPFDFDDVVARVAAGLTSQPPSHLVSSSAPAPPSL